MVTEDIKRICKKVKCKYCEVWVYMVSKHVLGSYFRIRSIFVVGKYIQIASYIFRNVINFLFLKLWTLELVQSLNRSRDL